MGRRDALQVERRHGHRRREEGGLEVERDEEEREDKADKRYRRFWNFSVRFAVVIGLLAVLMMFVLGVSLLSFMFPAAFWDAEQLAIRAFEPG